MAITPQRILHDYLLLALAALGGTATKRQALDWMEAHFGSVFSDEDRQPQPQRNEVKWENQTAWERNRMVEDGLIAPYRRGVSELGRWTLTDAGRVAATALGSALPSDQVRDSLATGTFQSHMLDPGLRKKIENAAQERLMARFRDDGWDVVDTRVGHPYDARAIKGDEVRYLEAKGTTTDGISVIVTRNEVSWARSHPGECVMGIWSGMNLDAEGNLLADIGEFRLLDWSPDDDELDASQYDWTPVASKVIN